MATVTNTSQMDMKTGPTGVSSVGYDTPPGDGGGIVLPRDDDTLLAIPIGEAILFISGTSLCVVMTVVGNILVILSVFTHRPLRSVQNFYIVSLAVADILVSICVMPFNIAYYVIGYWIFGEILCNMWLTFDILMCTASILNLCAIAIDRYYAIHDPINYAQKRTVKRVGMTILITWTVSIIISVPPLLGWNNSSGRNLYDDDNRTCELTDAKTFVVYSASGSFYIPLFIMTFVYIKIYLATRRRLRKRAKTAMHHLLGKSNGAKKACDETKHSDESNAGEQSSCDNSPDVTNSCAGGDPRGEATMATKSSSVCLDTRGPNEEHTNTPNEDTCNGNKLLPPPLPQMQLLSAKPKGSKFAQLKKKSKQASFRKAAGVGKGKKGSVKHNEHSVQHFMMEKQRISLSKERKAARTMSIIMGVFVLSWLPFFLMYIIFPFCGGCDTKVDMRIISFIVWLGYINSALNPIIYTVFNLDFRKAFKKLLACKC